MSSFRAYRAAWLAAKILTFDRQSYGPCLRNLSQSTGGGLTADASQNNGEPTVKTTIILTASLLALFAVPLSAQAQGIIGGGERGAEVGGRAAGPVGGVVGGVVGGAAGGVVGGVRGVVGAPRHHHYGSYHHDHYHHHHHYYH